MKQIQNMQLTFMLHGVNDIVYPVYIYNIIDIYSIHTFKGFNIYASTPALYDYPQIKHAPVHITVCL